MPGLNPKRINSFLAIIRDTRKPLEERNSALQALEREANKHVSAEQGRFETSLATFEQQWQKFEKTQFAFESSLDSILSSDVDEDEVDKLMQQVQDEVRLEKAHAPVSPAKKSMPTLGELERRLQALKAFNQSLMPNPKQEETEIAGREMDEEDELAQLERELDEEDLVFNPAALVGDVDDMITNTEAAIEDLEDELDDLEDKLQEPPAPEETFSQSYSTESSNDSLSDTQATASPQRKIKPSTPTTHTEMPAKESPAPSTQKPDKPGFFSKVAKNFMSFIKGVGNILRQIGGKSISLSDAMTKLKDAQRDLDASGRRLERASDRLKEAIGEIPAKRAELGNVIKQHQEAGKTVLRKQAALQKLYASKHLSPGDKTKAIKTLKGQITAAKQEHSQLGLHVRQVTRQLERATEKASTAHERLNDAKRMHKVVTKSFGQAIKHMEKALKQQHQDQDRLIGTQQKAKALLQESRSKYKEAQEQSTEKVVETSQTFSR